MYKIGRRAFNETEIYRKLNNKTQNPALTAGFWHTHTYFSGISDMPILKKDYYWEALKYYYSFIITQFKNFAIVFFNLTNSFFAQYL